MTMAEAIDIRRAAASDRDAVTALWLRLLEEHCGLDDRFAIPGTRYRIGLDGLVGLIPGIGDAIGAGASTYIVIRAAQFTPERPIDDVLQAFATRLVGAAHAADLDKLLLISRSGDGAVGERGTVVVCGWGGWVGVVGCGDRVCR